MVHPCLNAPEYEDTWRQHSQFTTWYCLNFPSLCRVQSHIGTRVMWSTHLFVLWRQLHRDSHACRCILWIKTITHIIMLVTHKQVFMYYSIMQMSLHNNRAATPEHPAIADNTGMKGKWARIRVRNGLYCLQVSYTSYNSSSSSDCEESVIAFQTLTTT